MVASKTSILVAAVAFGAASVYAAPAPLNKDIALTTREVDDSALIARDFDDDELYAREFFDELDARDFEDDLEARDFDEEELYARELFEDELEARDLFEDELEAREFFDDELEAREFFDDELEAREFFEDELEARALEDDDEEGVPSKPSSTTTPSSTPTPSSTSTSSATTPSSTTLNAAKDKHILAATSPSAVNSGKKDGKHRHHKHKHLHRMCKPYRKAYELLTGEKLTKHKVSKHKVDEHKVGEQTRPHVDHRPKHPKHTNQRHHRPTAEELAHECGQEIAALVAAKHHHKLDAAIDTSLTHSTALKVQTPESLKLLAPETLKVQTPTKAKRGLTQLWARVLGGKPLDQGAGQGYPDPAAGPSAEGSPSGPPPEGAENLATSSAPDGQQGSRNPGEYKKHRSHHAHQRKHKHKHHHCHQHPQSKHCRKHRHKRPHRHQRKPKQDAAGGAGLDATKGAGEPNPGAPVSDATALGNAAPAAGEPLPQAQAMRRSLEGDDLWERGLANSLGLDEDYFTKRFFDDEDVLEL